MLRTILILAVLALCAFMAGWFTIDRDEKETTIRFNRDEIRADASKAIARGSEILKGEEQHDNQTAPYVPPEFDNSQYGGGSYETAPYPPQYSQPGYDPNNYDPSGYAPPNYAPQQATRPAAPWEPSGQGYSANPPAQY